MISFAIIIIIIIIISLYLSGLVLTRGILIYTVEPRSKMEQIAVIGISLVWPLLAIYLTIKYFIK